MTVERQTVGEETAGDFGPKELGQDGRHMLSNGEILGSSYTGLENGSSRPNQMVYRMAYRMKT